MKTIAIYNMLITAILAAMCLSYAWAEEEKDEMMQAYAADMTKYIEQAQADLRETETMFADEKSEFLENTTFNQRIIELKKQQIGIMKELLRAIGKQDSEKIEELEKQQEVNQHMLNIIGTEKDMALILGDLRKRAEYKKIDNPAQLKESIRELEAAFHGILATEDTVFSETQRLKSLYKEKEKKLAECESLLESGKK